MSVRDHDLVRFVGEYLIAHASLNYVDLQDMVDTIQASSYRYSRMKKQVFANLVRRAYQVYCEQNNLVHNQADNSVAAAPDSDSDIQIEDPPTSSVIKNQMNNLYLPIGPTKAQSSPPITKSPVRLPFRPAFEVPPSRAARQAQAEQGAAVPSPASPACSDVSSQSEDDDLQIIAVHGTRNGTNTEGGTPTRPTTVVKTLQPIIKSIGDKKAAPAPNATSDELAEPERPTSGNPNTPSTPAVSISLSPAENGDQAAKRGTKRKLEAIGEQVEPPLNQSSRRNRQKISNPEAGGGAGLAAGIASKKAKKQVAVVQDSGVTFSDFGGNDKIIEDICKLLMHLKHPEIYRELGVVPPRGFLLHGAPGCGKTLLANAIAGELKMPMLKVAATELISGISGESENNIRDLFEQAVGLAPCIIFIDEIDSITPKRETAQREMERRIVSQLLTCIDELASKVGGDQVLLIGATNRIETIDVALRRAGRFDREICLGIPDVKAREQILRVLFRNLRLSPEFDFALLAKLTPGYVGADLQALMREAAVQAVDKILTDQAEVRTIEKSIPALPEVSKEQELKNNNQDDISSLDTQEANQASETADNAAENDDKQVEGEKAHESEIVSSVEADKQVSANEEPMQVDDSTKIASETKDEASKLPASVLSSANPKPMEKDFLKWIRDSAPLSAADLTDLCLHMEDFERALKYVQPSSKREGFATVPDTTWDDIGALVDIREELQVSILGPVKHASAFQSLGLNSPAGVLLCGPPGCGKTLLAKAVANEAGINFISVKGPELLNMYVGESERAVRQCFLRAKNSSPCVIFFDELDALCPRRSDGVESGSTSRVVNQLLTEMDGMESRAGVFVMAATNRPDIIDPAILRPGRLDKVIFVNLPTPTDRFDILKAITKNGTRPRFADDIDLKSIAVSEKLDGFTGADLAAIVREASIAAFRELVLEAGKAGVAVCADENLKVYSRHFGTAMLRTKPSVTTKDREKYEQMKERYSSLLT